MDCTCAVVTGSTVSEAITVPFRVAVIATLVCVGTPNVLIEKVPESAPAAIARVEVVGEATAVFALDIATVTPPAGAAEERVTVPVEVPPGPPSTSEGDSVRDATLGGGGGSCILTASGTPVHPQATEQRAAISVARKIPRLSRPRVSAISRLVVRCFRIGIDLPATRGQPPSFKL